MSPTIDVERLRAQIITSTELLLSKTTASVALECIIQALENKKQYMRREDDRAARRSIDSKIEKIQGIL